MKGKILINDFFACTYMKLATLVYVQHEQKTLMIHRNKRKGDIHEGLWNGLGGKFEPGETPEECARREVLEESGLTIKMMKYKGLITFVNFKGDDWYVFVFTGKGIEGTLHDPDEGHLEWIADEKILDLPLNEDDYLFIPWLKKRGVFSAKFVYHGDKIVDHSVHFYP